VTSTTKTPSDLAIQHRDLQFGRDTTHPRWWVGGDPVATAFYNALSATFPMGERFFMEAVKAFRHKTDGKLKQQVADFLFQESMHSREHVVFNRMAEDAGYDMKPLEERARKHIAIARSKPAILQLAATCALEHFTAILANAVLSDPRHFAGAPEEAQRMWRWHAMEEIEHKAVAYDTYMAATAHLPGFVRYLRRCLVMVVATGIFFSAIGGNIRDHFRQDGIDNRETWRRLRHFLWREPGIARTVLGSYFKYYKPGFHPWDEDDRALLTLTEQSLAAA
jgi:predicted metal-dependent hydrolase